MTSRSRESIAKTQAELVRALVHGAPVPAGAPVWSAPRRSGLVAAWHDGVPPPRRVSRDRNVGVRRGGPRRGGAHPHGPAEQRLKPRI